MHLRREEQIVLPRFVHWKVLCAPIPRLRNIGTQAIHQSLSSSFDHATLLNPDSLPLDYVIIYTNPPVSKR